MSDESPAAELHRDRRARLRDDGVAGLTAAQDKLALNSQRSFHLHVAEERGESVDRYGTKDVESTADNQIVCGENRTGGEDHALRHVQIAVQCQHSVDDGSRFDIQ